MKNKTICNEIQRDSRLDVLRGLAIVLILLAHISDAPPALKNIRNFDVPLMAILLGASYQLTKGKNLTYLSYIKKRIKRLIIPTWSFFAIFFVIMYARSVIMNQNYFSILTIIRTFILLDGVGYVWIIRIFFTIALISPLLNASYENFYFNYQRFIVLMIFLCIQYILCQFGPTDNVIYREMICNTFGYVILGFVGMMMINQTTLMNFCIFVLGAIQFIVFGINNNFEALQLNKYPPTLYFLGYGMMISCGLFIILTLFDTKRVELPDIIKFLSNQSMSIYYWHILIVIIINSMNVSLNWFITFIIVLGLACSITILNNKFVPNLLLPFNWKFTRKLLSFLDGVFCKTFIHKIAEEKYTILQPEIIL